MYRIRLQKNEVYLHMPCNVNYWGYMFLIFIHSVDKTGGC